MGVFDRVRRSNEWKVENVKPTIYKLVELDTEKLSIEDRKKYEGTKQALEGINFYLLEKIIRRIAEKCGVSDISFPRIDEIAIISDMQEAPGSVEATLQDEELKHQLRINSVYFDLSKNLADNHRKLLHTLIHELTHYAINFKLQTKDGVVFDKTILGKGFAFNSPTSVFGITVRNPSREYTSLDEGMTELLTQCIEFLYRNILGEGRGVFGLTYTSECFGVLMLATSLSKESGIHPDIAFKALVKSYFNNQPLTDSEIFTSLPRKIQGDILAFRYEETYKKMDDKMDEFSTEEVGKIILSFAAEFSQELLGYSFPLKIKK